ncbi:MAG: sigma-70 family RNA polymerase sigma factor [Bacteroidota bacterium]
MRPETEFIQTIKDNEGIIYKITRVYTNDRASQEDLYQEIVYQLWKSFETFEGRSKRSTWIYRVALNTAIAYLNREKRRGPSVALDLEFDDQFTEEDEDLEAKLSLLYDHIQRLNVIEKGLILLHLEGRSYEEIAAITGFSKSNVGTRLGRIRQKLKTNIKK